MAVGVASGALNAVAAGGSFLTLPVLLFLGLPSADANGTNRVGVISQSVGAIWTFHQHRVLDWRWALAVSTPAVVGAALGAWVAILVPDFAFRRILSIVMLAVTVSSIARDWSDTGITRGRADPKPPRHWAVVGGFFVAGFYGGFLQAGVGFLVLAITTAAGLDLIRGNAVKVVSVLLLTSLSLAIFAGAGRVQWRMGLALGLGNLIGSLLGVRMAVRLGHRWLQRLLTITMVVFAILLWITE